MPLPLLLGALLAAPAAHALPPGRVQFDGVLGMRVGGGALAVVEPVPHLETGGALTVVTDFYAMSPAWVRDGLDPVHNLRVSPKAVVGVNTGQGVFQAALLGMAGVEVSTFRERRTVPALDTPVDYGTTEVVVLGGTAVDLRLQPWEHLGMHLMVYLSLPPPPSGPVDIERAHGALGATWRW